MCVCTNLPYFHPRADSGAQQTRAFHGRSPIQSTHRHGWRRAPAQQQPSPSPRPTSRLSPREARHSARVDRRSPLPAEQMGAAVSERTNLGLIGLTVLGKSQNRFYCRTIANSAPYRLGLGAIFDLPPRREHDMYLLPGYSDRARSTAPLQGMPWRGRPVWLRVLASTTKRPYLRLVVFAFLFANRLEILPLPIPLARPHLYGAGFCHDCVIR